jgi:hypothetical protein
MVRLSAWTFACCVLVGCGGNTNFSVTGHVKFKDGRDIKVLERGVVILESTEEEKKTMSSRGTIRADGSFTIGTNTDTDGAPPGKYIVLVTPPALARPADRPKLKGWPPVKEKYSLADQTPFKFEVQKKDNVLELEVD